MRFDTAVSRVVDLTRITLAIKTACAIRRWTRRWRIQEKNDHHFPFDINLLKRDMCL